MHKSETFKPYLTHIDQPFLLPPDMREWLSEDHMAYFVMEVVNELDLKNIFGKYDRSKGGNSAFHPKMMTALLIYAYCVGMPSSRKIEKATYEMVPFRIISGGCHPDHDTIADFRHRHLKDLAGLFVQVLKLCRKAGLVKLGHVAFDGTKVKANASKHKAMSYGRMGKAISELEREVLEMLTLAEESARTGKKAKGKPPTAPDPETATPKDKAQKNFTDPESRMGISKNLTIIVRVSSAHREPLGILSSRQARRVKSRIRRAVS